MHILLSSHWWTLSELFIKLLYQNGFTILLFLFIFLSWQSSIECVLFSLCSFFLFSFTADPWYHEYVMNCHCYSSFQSVVQFSSVAQLCPTLCSPMDCSTPGLPVHHQLPELTLTHVHRVGDAIQPSHPLSSPSPAFSLSQHQGLFQWVSSLHQVAKVLELALEHQSFQWIFRTDFL